MNDSGKSGFNRMVGKLVISRPHMALIANGIWSLLRAAHAIIRHEGIL